MANVVFEEKAKKSSLLKEEVFIKGIKWILHWDVKKGLKKKELISIVEAFDSSPDFKQIINSKQRIQAKLPKRYGSFKIKLVGAELFSSYVQRFKNGAGPWGKFLVKFKNVFLRW